MVDDSDRSIIVISPSCVWMTQQCVVMGCVAYSLPEVQYLFVEFSIVNAIYIAFSAIQK